MTMDPLPSARRYASTPAGETSFSLPQVDLRQPVDPERLRQLAAMVCVVADEPHQHRLSSVDHVARRVVGNNEHRAGAHRTGCRVSHRRSPTAPGSIVGGGVEVDGR
ncbi:MAG: hypothetical protein H0V04_06330 [Chloroflexi bacterium]|nr:hypothetical protein [Chloroflexota bacterium]